MKKLICLIACAAAMGCSQSWYGETNAPSYNAQSVLNTGPENSENHLVISKRLSQKENCLAKKRGMDDADTLCDKHVEAGEPNTDKRCDTCVDDPYYGWDRAYGYWQ